MRRFPLADRRRGKEDATGCCAGRQHGGLGQRGVRLGSHFGQKVW